LPLQFFLTDLPQGSEHLGLDPGAEIDLGVGLVGSEQTILIGDTDYRMEQCPEFAVERVAGIDQDRPGKSAFGDHRLDRFNWIAVGHQAHPMDRIRGQLLRAFSHLRQAEPRGLGSGAEEDENISAFFRIQQAGLAAIYGRQGRVIEDVLADRQVGEGHALFRPSHLRQQQDKTAEEQGANQSISHGIPPTCLLLNLIVHITQPMDGQAIQKLMPREGSLFPDPFTPLFFSIIISLGLMAGLGAGATGFGLGVINRQHPVLRSKRNAIAELVGIF